MLADVNFRDSSLAHSCRIKFSVILLPVKPIEVLGCAGCFSMAEILGLAEVCC